MTAEGHSCGIGSQLARSGFHLVDIGYLDTLSRLLVDDALQLQLRLFLVLHSLFELALCRTSIINWGLEFKACIATQDPLTGLQVQKKAPVLLLEHPQLFIELLEELLNDTRELSQLYLSIVLALPSVVRRVVFHGILQISVDA